MCIAFAIEDLDGVIVHKLVAGIIFDPLGEEDSRCWIGQISYLFSRGLLTER